MLITSKLTNQSARKALFTCVVYTNLGYSPVGNIRSRDVFRPIARERKYLADYKNVYPAVYPVCNNVACEQAHL